MPPNGLLRKTKAANRYLKKQLRGFLIAAVVVLISANIFAENRKLIFGEKLVYDIYWKFFKVGYGTLEVKGVPDIKNRKVYQIYSEAKSASFFDVFYRVRDTNISWIDAEKFYSIAFQQSISEGSYKRERMTEYFNEWHLAKNESGEIFDIPDNVLDVLASLYWVRVQELTPGQDLEMNVNSGKKSYSMRVRIIKKEKVNINGKKYNTVLVQPDLRDAGIFMSKGKIFIWMTDDQFHIPVVMKSEISVGSIWTELRTPAVPQGKPALPAISTGTPAASTGTTAQ